MPTYSPSKDELDSLESEWRDLDSEFQTYRDFRAVDSGTWPMLAQGRLQPEVIPELKEHVQGAYTMFGELDDDLRILNAIHSMNPTRYDVHAAGLSEQAKKVESNWKLYWSSVWTQYLNYGRWLDEYVYSGQNALGLSVYWLRWCAHKDEDGTVRGAPVQVEKVLAECLRFKGNYRNPKAAWIKYSVSAIDADLKNVKGERPAYADKDSLDSLGWASEPLPEDFYTTNAGKEIDVIVRDAEDPVVMCPLAGCYHRKRRITIYICKKGGEVKDYEKVEEYDSPFATCSFHIVGGDVREHERDPHRIFRPAAWILYSIIDAWNRDATTLDGLLRKQLSNDQLYADSTGTPNDTLTALTINAEGGNRNSIDKPEVGTQQIPVMPTVKILPQPSIDGLFRRLDMHEQRYAQRKPNPALIGQMAISEVSATVGQIQAQGAGVPIGPDLAHWDSGQVRIAEEIRHGIRFTANFEPGDEKTRYVAMVTGNERVYGKRYSSAGEEVYLDAKMCEHDVVFTAETSKDTPSERQQRVQEALDLHNRGFYARADVYKAIDVFDAATQDEKIAAEFVDKLLMPMFARGVAATTTGRFTARTGMDFGQTLGVNNIPLPGGDGSQVHNTAAANAKTTVAPLTPLAPTGTPTGGSDGLA